MYLFLSLQIASGILGIKMNPYTRSLRDVMFVDGKLIRIPKMSSRRVPLRSEDFDEFTKEELVARVIKSELHVIQLKNLLDKQAASRNQHKSEGKRTNRRDFDFKRYNKRHIALKICYLGWDYNGLVVQEDTRKTIEVEVFAALERTCLIESRETSNYHRCGRTDKGVSAFGQVISIDVRSNLLEGEGLIIDRANFNPYTRQGNSTQEIDYANVLNKVLPGDIRVLAWAPVMPEFSARFHCIQRIYKYYFPVGDLNIELMKQASTHFVGQHDFRNFCKMDVANGVVNYERVITKVEINAVPESSASQASYQMYEITVAGQAFLWHQIRCLVAVLFLVGKGQEKPEIVSQLLDIEKNPCRPQYNMALDLPLVLYDCTYPNVSWKYSEEAHTATLSHLQKIWSRHAIKTTAVRQMLSGLERQQLQNASGSKKRVRDQTKCLMTGCQQKVYKPLLSRPKCESLERRVEIFSKRLKKDSDNETPKDTKPADL